MELYSLLATGSLMKENACNGPAVRPHKRFIAVSNVYWPFAPVEDASHVEHGRSPKGLPGSLTHVVP